MATTNPTTKDTPKSVFETLNAIDCSEHIEKIGEGKNALTYLSWAWAWTEVKKRYPRASYTIYESPEGFPYWTDGRTCWVKTGVTIEDLEHIECLPVMDYNHRSIALERVTSTDWNKTIQRSLTKACARHGLGLYIYAGEDLPEPTDGQNAPAPGKGRKAAPAPEAPAFQPMSNDNFFKCVMTYASGFEPSGVGNIREYYIRKTHAGAKEIADFDLAVQNYKNANNL